MSPAELIYQLLIAEGLIETSGTGFRASVSFMPDTPDSFVTVYDTAGKFDGRIMASGEQVEHPGIQIRVRGIDYPTTWAKANEIAKSLDAQRNSTVSFSSTDRFRLRNVTRTGPILPMGVEEVGERRRFNLTINATLTYEQV